ncbi:type II TA system antitoxin MqsA family protein [Cetobacterium sp.]|uniref:type II TA system antitoxin MqsA family protein n=1 Tax=Cetobacterium sp. TaxID=2071632 RepID=UPI003EE600ED
MEKFKCKICDENHLEIITEMRTVEIKGKKILYEAEYYFCPELEEVFEEGDLINKNLNRARDVYRKESGLLTIAEIVEIRGKYNLSQRDLAIILGMGEATISRIESKIIQDKSTDDSIRRIANDPLFLLEKLELNKEKLGKKYDSIKSILKQDQEVCIYSKKILELYYINLPKDDNIRGNANLNLGKIENMILFFLKECKKVYKTKLNKLLWYADFKNFQTTNYSISGLVYEHKPFGAVPIGIDEIIKCSSFIQMEEKENETVGYTYFKFIPLKEYDSKFFTKEEIETLQSIAQKFKDFGNKEISNYMHQETAYTQTIDNEIISYSYATSLKYL